VDGTGPARDPGGDVDDLVSDGRAAGFGVRGAGEVTGGTGQAMGDHGARHPRPVGLEVTRWQMCQRSVDQIGVDLFAEPAFPARNLLAAITDAGSGVEIVASSGL
jgi:hypothetical protein